ncbi:hypothetical protein LMG1231_06127 [Achromobacter denitrificans]|nr:hypothetical protein LMG1231_06127 [Achromobacter denitrificans]
MSCLISLAAAALRCASVRTSLATTAKPLPCSPARAASTAALSARMLVWNAMPSITPTMSAMRDELPEMARMVSTTLDTASPPRRATAAEAATMRFASSAVSAFCLTVVASSSMLAAVSSRVAACSSVRLERSALPDEISCAPTLISSTPRRTADTVRTRLSCMLLSAASSTPISFLPRSATRRVRSPSAMRRKISPASSSGRRMMRRISTCAPTAMSRPSARIPASKDVNRAWKTEISSMTRCPVPSARRMKASRSVMSRSCTCWVPCLK